MKRLFPLMLVLGLAACGDKPAETPAAAEPAPAAAEPAATPAPEAPAETAPAADAPTEAAAPVEGEPAATPAPEAPADTAPAAETPADAGAPVEGEPTAPAAPESPAPAAPAVDMANAPREGIDYTVLASPQPTYGQGGIEVAEVFAYTCIHCANLQPLLNSWKAQQPSDVRFTYVPGAFGGIADNFARGYFAAEATGLLDKTHDNLFKAVLIERKFQTASVEEIADWYASQGADRDAFLSTMQSFAVNAKLNRARQFAMRTGVESTPTMIVNGKYSAIANGERGAEGLLQTVDWLVARERAAAAAAAPAATPEPAAQ
jgi:thiol:disulfide interchange protein DsbA